MYRQGHEACERDHQVEEVEAATTDAPASAGEGSHARGVLSQWDISAPFYFAAALAFANAVLLYFTLPETAQSVHFLLRAASVSACHGLFGLRLPQPPLTPTSRSPIFPAYTAGRTRPQHG